MRFLLIDRVTSWEAGRRATALKNVAMSEDFFADHFPHKPIMPGVLLLEGMAQLAGILLEEAVQRERGTSVKAVISIVEKAKFRRPVYPGDQLLYTAQITAVSELGGCAVATAACQGELCVEATLIFAFVELANERLERRRQEIVSLWKRDVGCADAT